jgi:hypothetical protein
MRYSLQGISEGSWLRSQHGLALWLVNTWFTACSWQREDPTSDPLLSILSLGLSASVSANSGLCLSEFSVEVFAHLSGRPSSVVFFPWLLL